MAKLNPGGTADALIFVRGYGQEVTGGKAFLGAMAHNYTPSGAIYYIAVVDAHNGSVLYYGIANNGTGSPGKKPGEPRSPWRNSSIFPKEQPRADESEESKPSDIKLKSLRFAARWPAAARKGFFVRLPGIYSSARKRASETCRATTIRPWRDWIAEVCCVVLAPHDRLGSA